MKLEIRSGIRFASLHLLACALAIIVSQPAISMTQDDASRYFRTNCSPCHTIGGGRLVGPDLKDVTSRQDRTWLLEFIQNPQAKFDAGDSYALKILAEANNVPMIPVVGMTAKIAGEMLDLIESESGLENGAFRGIKKLPEPTAEDRTLGQALFSGQQSLTRGGPPCISCHTVSGLGGFGGGRLGPDLTKATERFGGFSGLYAWLQAPPTAQMQANFRDHPFDEAETFALAAYLGDIADKVENDIFGNMNLFSFTVLGLMGALGFIIIFGGIWGQRLRGVRKPMVAAARKSRKNFKLESGGQSG